MSGCVVSRGEYGLGVICLSAVAGLRCVAAMVGVGGAATCHLGGNESGVVLSRCLLLGCDDGVSVAVDGV